jgi:glycine hydroxymethyltransferase
VTTSRAWLPAGSAALAAAVESEVFRTDPAALMGEVEHLAAASRKLHEADYINLNPAGNVMTTRAEALLAQGLGTRPSLGYPGAKHEAGVAELERIELIAASLASRLFGARYADVRLPSGSIANLAVFMATIRPGETIISPPAAIGGHASCRQVGAAGRYGLRVIEGPVDASAYSYDLAALRQLCRAERPRLVVVGGSLNLFPHPLGAIVEIARETGALVLYDAAHVAGLIAGDCWQNPLIEGADIVTMSTYKSLGGPAGGLVLTNDAALAEAIDDVVFPALTANFDMGRVAALAVSLAESMAHGRVYAETMCDNAAALATALDTLGVELFGRANGFTRSHQLAITAGTYGGAQRAQASLFTANLLTTTIGLPGDGEFEVGGIRLGTSELTRIGLRPSDMSELASLIAHALRDPPEPKPAAATALRRRFRQ